MLSRLVLLFVTVPLLELALLLQVGQWIGLGATITLVVATGLAGAALARQQGLRAFLAVQNELATGRLPGRSLLDGLSVLVGGALLLTPGILTDLLGFSLILPFSRRWLQRRLRQRMEQRMRKGTVELGVFGSSGFAGFSMRSTGWGATRRRPIGEADERASPSPGGSDPDWDADEEGGPRQELGTHRPGQNPLRAGRRS